METEVEEKSAETKDLTDDEVMVYELGYHILSSVGDEQIPAEVSKVKAVIERHGGKFIMEEFPTLIRLAYTIVRSRGGKREKYDTTYFGWTKFELPRGIVTKIQEDLTQNENVLRFLIIRTVREDTRAPKRVTMPREEVKEKEEEKPAAPPRAEAEPETPVSEEELDRTIDKLVVE